MSPINLPFIRVIRPTRGGTYYYFDTGRRKPGGGKLWLRLPDPSEPNFGDKYAAMKAARTRRANVKPPPVTFPLLVRLYEKSPQFAALGEGTKRYYVRYLGEVGDIWRDTPVADISPADVRELVDSRADKPGVGNTMLKVARMLFGWAKKRGYMPTNPATEIEAFASVPHEPWPEAVLQAALASPDERLRVTVALCYYTALRISDAARVTWAILADNGVSIIVQKTRKAKPEPVFIPLHPALRSILEGATRRHVTVLTNKGATGPATKESAIKMVEAFGSAHGVHLVTHGLRKNAVIALLEAGCSVAQTSAISGQSLQIVEYYARGRDQKKLATAAILQWAKK